jgi:hypothetical protein
VRWFGLLVLGFGALLAALALRRPAGLGGAAAVLAGAWVVGLALRREARGRPWAGLALPAGLGAVAAARLGLGVPGPWVAGALALAAGVAALAVWLAPAWGARLWVGWMRAAEPMGWVVSHVVLAIVYYGVLTPVGLVMRLAGRDPMQRRFDKRAASYWVERKDHGDPGRYFRQF